MLCAKFGRNWPGGSGEENENVNVFDNNNDDDNDDGQILIGIEFQRFQNMRFLVVKAVVYEKTYLFITLIRIPPRKYLFFPFSMDSLFSLFILKDTFSLNFAIFTD